MIEKYDPNKLIKKLAVYRTWLEERKLQSRVLVHYSGVSLIGVKELALDDVEKEITGLVEEAFYVDWTEHESKVYLRVWEYGGPEPEWAKVFAYDDLADIDAILREAGFEPD